MFMHNCFASIARTRTWSDSSVPYCLAQLVLAWTPVIQKIRIKFNKKYWKGYIKVQKYTFMNQNSEV